MRICVILLLVCFKGLCQNTGYAGFSGKPVKIDHTAQLDTPYFLDYDSYQYSGFISPLITEVAEKVVSDKHWELLAQNTSDSTVYTIKLSSKLSFYYQGSLVSIIKYKIKKDNYGTGVKTIQAQKQMNKWVEVGNENIKKIEHVFGILTTEAFWQFYDTDNDSRYPEINALKYLVKDENGILNIEKLAEVVTQNKNDLEPFFEKLD